MKNDTKLEELNFRMLTDKRVQQRNIRLENMTPETLSTAIDALPDLLHNVGHFNTKQPAIGQFDPFTLHRIQKKFQRYTHQSGKKVK